MARCIICNKITSSGFVIDSECLTKLKDENARLQNTIREYQEKVTRKALVQNKRIPGIGKCPTCKHELCMDEDLHYCPECGQALADSEWPRN